MPMPAEADNIPSNFEPIKIGTEPPRDKEPIWLCTDPDGKVHEVAQRNVRDWERRGAGWTVNGKKEKLVKAKTVAEPETVTQTVAEVPALVDAPQADLAPDVVAPLQALRDRATALGITVDARWGMKRLTKEIESVSPEQE